MYFLLFDASYDGWGCVGGDYADSEGSTVTEKMRAGISLNFT